MSVKKIICTCLLVLMLASLYLIANTVNSIISNKPRDSMIYQAVYNYNGFINRLRSCQDDKSQVVGKDCNQYVQEIYDACGAADTIQDPKTKQCVSVRDFKKPLIGCDLALYCKDMIPYPGYKAFDSGKDVYKLFQLEGNVGSDHIIVFLQGGPSETLNTDYMKEFEKDFSVAYVQQTNTLKPYLLKSYDLSTNEALKEQQESIQIVKQVYEQLRKDFPHKKFILAGHSMGAFLVPYYLSEYPNHFDKVLIMAGRLRVDADFLNGFSIGRNIVFNYIHDMDLYLMQNKSFKIDPLKKYMDKNYQAKTPAPQGEKLVQNYHSIADTNMLAALGSMDFIKLLDQKKLDNVLYIYSSKDEQLDTLNSVELEFLKSKGVFVADAGTSPVNGHSAMLLPDYAKKIVKKLKNEAVDFSEVPTK